MLSDFVFVHGKINNYELLQKLSHFHFGVISSLTETFNVSGIEFLGNGIPVVSTPCGGPNEYINSNNGIITNDFSSDSIFDGMYKLVNNKLYDRQSISNEIRIKFGPEVFMERLNNCYI